MQETRFQLYLAQQHIEEINFNRFAVLIAVFVVIQADTVNELERRRDMFEVDVGSFCCLVVSALMLLMVTGRAAGL